MTADDLLKQFGLDEEISSSDSELRVRDLQQERQDIAELPEHALDLDEWGKGKGQQLIQESELLGEIYKSQVTGESAEQMHAIGQQVADFYGAAFELEPKLNESCRDSQRHEFMSNLIQTPEYNALHKTTQLDAQASELAAAAFGQQYVQLIEQQQQEADEQGESSGAQTQQEQERQQMRKEVQSISAASQACEQAAQDVQDLNDTREAFGIGQGAGGGGSMSQEQLADMFKRVRQSHSLKRIAELAGRYRRLAAAKQKQKTQHGRDDMVGVELDGDAGRLVGSELAQLSHPMQSMRLDALRRLVERQSMCRKYEGIEKVAKGPIMAFLDESGSMGGEKSYTAKAIALALAWIAKQQRRWVCLVAFSGSAAIENLRVIVLAPGRWDQTELMQWLEAFQSGGTTLDWLHGDTMDALYRMTRAERGKTDVVVITDGAVHLSESVVHSFNQWKKSSQAKLISIEIGRYGGSPLEQVSDKMHCVNSLGIEQDAVGDILSI